MPPDPTHRPDDRTAEVLVSPGRYLRHAALLIALIAVGAAVLSWGAYTTVVDGVRRDAELSARGAAADVDRYVQSRWTTLQALASVPAIRSGDLDAIRDLYRDLDPAALGFEAGMAFIDSQGVARARAGQTDPEPLDLSDRAYVRRALTTGQPVVSEVVAGRLTDVPVVSFLVPVRGADGGVAGLVGGGLRLDTMTVGADSIRFAGGTAVVVIDAAGNLVTGRGPVTTLQAADPSLPLAAMREQELGNLTGTGPQGEADQLLGYGLAPSAGWLVLVERPAAEAFGVPSFQLGGRLMVIAVLAGIAVLVLMWAERRVEASARAERATLQRLQVAVAELERREHLREAFVSVMSHELRTPVTSIYAASKLLARDPRRPELESLLGDIEEEAERLHRITEDLLVLSRAEHGVDIRPEPVLLQRVAPTVAAVTQRRYPSARIAIELPPDLPPVSGDPGAVRQVLDNLLANAAKYGRGSEIAIRASVVGEAVDLAVEDGGPGLPDAERAHMFDLFYRAGSNLKEASGTGIGLFVVAQLVTSMGGTVVAEPREPHGLRVVVRLPTATAAEAGFDLAVAEAEAAAVAGDAAEPGAGEQDAEPARPSRPLPA
jgi:signal transduction histidine kinase